MKYPVVALTALSVITAEAKLRGKKVAPTESTSVNRRLASCMGDISETHTGPCAADEIRATLLNLYQQAETAGTCTGTTFDDELAVLLSPESSLETLCAAANAAHEATFLPYQDISKMGDTFDREFLNGGSSWNTRVEDADGNYNLASDASRINMVAQTHSTSNGIGWPTNPAISSVQDCANNAVMCCYVSDRQADSHGSCAGPGCEFAEPDDNTDICYMDMSNAPASARVRNGVAVYDMKDPTSDSEGAAYCEGFAWADGELSEKYKGNLLFEVAMNKNLYTKGYVQNVPGAPMCGCIEKMPVVSEAACTDVSATESWSLSATGDETLQITFNNVAISYGGACDLASSVTNGIDFIKGTDNCYDAVTEFASTSLQLTRSTLSITGAVGYPTQTAVAVTFSKPVHEDGATVDNFLIDNGLEVLGAEVHPIHKNQIILTTTAQDPDTTYTITLDGVVTKAVAPMIKATEGSTVEFVPTSYGLEANVPEAEDYLLLYDLDIPARPQYQSVTPDYEYGTVPFKEYDRVAYFMELESLQYGHQWVWASLPKFFNDNDIMKIGVPTPKGPVGRYVYQGAINTANVYTNHQGIADAGEIMNTTVNLEFWYHNYATGNDGNYDWADIRSTREGHGSMQIHVPGQGTTLFAFNNFGRNKQATDAPVALGIGNNPNSQHTDWTFENNADMYTLKNLKVLVKPTGVLEDPEPNMASSLDDAAGFELIYDLDIPQRPNFKTLVPYSTNFAIFRPNGSFSRVAYYMELQESGKEPEWVWVSFNTFTDDAKQLGIPTLESRLVFQEQVTEMNVYSSEDGMTATNITGGVEFWPFSYGPKNAAGIDGASDVYFDYGDEPGTSGDHGSFQIFAETMGHGTTLFGFNRWNRGHQAELGIGRNPTGHPDWTLTQNSDKYVVKKLQIFVK